MGESGVGAGGTGAVLVMWTVSVADGRPQTLSDGDGAHAIVHGQLVAPADVELRPELHRRAEVDRVREAGVGVRLEEVVLRSRHLGPGDVEELERMKLRAEGGRGDDRGHRGRRAETGHGEAARRRERRVEKAGGSLVLRAPHSPEVGAVGEPADLARGRQRHVAVEVVVARSDHRSEARARADLPGVASDRAVRIHDGLPLDRDRLDEGGAVRGSDEHRSRRRRLCESVEWGGEKRENREDGKPAPDLHPTLLRPARRINPADATRQRGPTLAVRLNDSLSSLDQENR